MNLDEARRVLGVAAASGPADIRAAYRRLAQRHHPDRHAGDTSALRRFQEIQQAFRVLSGRTRPDGSPPPRATPRPPAHPSWSHADIGVWRMGVRAPLNMAMHGGVLYCSARPPWGGSRVTWAVALPAGWPEGQAWVRQVRAPDGSLWRLSLAFQWSTLRGWSRHHHDLIRAHRLTPAAMMRGTTIRLRHPSGVRLLIKVPAGTLPGACLRLRGQGLPIMDQDSRGDVRVTLLPRAQAR